MTRGGRSISQLEQKGVVPVIGNYTDKASLNEAFKKSRAKMLFLITDFFLAAKGNYLVEINQGMMAIDVAKENGCEFVVFCSVADCDIAPHDVLHFRSKFQIEKYLDASGLNYGILRPVAFLDNLDDPANYNPLVEGTVKMLTGCVTLQLVKQPTIYI